MHSDSLVANQSQPVPQVANDYLPAIADAKNQRLKGHPEVALRELASLKRKIGESGDLRAQALLNLELAACQITLFEYGPAERSAKAALKAAEENGDRMTAARASGNLSTIYAQLGDFSVSEQYATRTVTTLRSLGDSPLLSQSLLGAAVIQFKRGEYGRGLESSNKAVEVARRVHAPAFEAFALDYKGILLLLSRGPIPEASEALNAAAVLYTTLKNADGLAMTLEHRAEFELAAGHPAQALSFIDQAFASAGPQFKANPQYYPLHVRGQILLALGREDAALAEFRKAVDVASAWRDHALPGDTTNTQTVAQLQSVYSDFAQLAARVSLSRHDPDLSALALTALMDNRAASLREQLGVVIGDKLRDSPDYARYLQVLASLKSAQARVTLAGNSSSDQAQLEHLQAELSDVENTIGLGIKIVPKRREKVGLQNSLRDIQTRLARGEALLSFCTGTTKSYLWAVTVEQVRLYELPSEEEIAKRVETFTTSVQKNRDVRASSEHLSKALFSSLENSIWLKHDWLMTGDGPLSQALPVCLLRNPTVANSSDSLVQDHTVRLLPSELLLLNTRTKPATQRFVGIGDPIYNSADTRRAPGVRYVTARGTAAPITLSRLAGSDREIRSAASVTGSQDIKLLLGREATFSGLADALTTPPEIIHFAVHVVSPEGRPEQSALALSTDGQGIPELLTREAIASLHVPGSLVVLSGCSSGKGKAVPGAGLLGLSRAWLLAGASAVVVSAWPTPDDSGQFFSAFYNHLREAKTGSLAQRAASALQQAQLQLQRSGGYRSSPSFWGAYSIVTKE